MIGIYRIRNEINGKVYYGQTIDFEKRRKEHINQLNGGYHRNQYLLHSWRKYGESAFTFTFVESCLIDELDELEIKYIAENNTLAPNGYNLTSGGHGIRGFRFSSQQREKLGKRMKMLWKSNEFREKMREVHRGHEVSADTRLKMSKSHVGQPPPYSRSVMCVETGCVYPAVRKVCVKDKKVNPSNISRACNLGIRAYGYHWKYVDDP